MHWFNSLFNKDRKPTKMGGRMGGWMGHFVYSFSSFRICWEPLPAPPVIPHGSTMCAGCLVCVIYTQIHACVCVCACTVFFIYSCKPPSQSTPMFKVINIPGLHLCFHLPLPPLHVYDDSWCAGDHPRLRPWAQSSGSQGSQTTLELPWSGKKLSANIWTVLYI
jgi:hypothetical protein